MIALKMGTMVAYCNVIKVFKSDGREWGLLQTAPEGSFFKTRIFVSAQ